MELNLPVVKGLGGDKTVNVLRGTGCEGVVVSRRLVQGTGKCCLIVRIDNTVLLEERARIHIKTPYLSGDVEALCIPEVICDLVVGNVPGVRNPDDPDMSVMVSAVTTRAQEIQEAVRKPLRVPDAVKHTGVDRAELIRLQREDYAIKKMGEAAMSTGRAGKTSFFKKKNGIVYRVSHDMARGETMYRVSHDMARGETMYRVCRDMARGETTIQQVVTKTGGVGQEETDNPDEAEVLPPGWERGEHEDGPYYWHFKSGTIQRDPLSPVLADCRDPPQRSTSSNSWTSNEATEGVITSGTDTPFCGEHLQEFEGHAFKYATESLKTLAKSKEETKIPSKEAEPYPIRFAVRSLGWARINEEDLTPERSSKAVNRCIVDLSLRRNDINDVVGRWGVGRDNGRDFAYVARDLISRKLLLQWKGPYDVTKVVGLNEYKVLMKGKENTLHANLLKKYVVREDHPVDNAVPAVHAYHQQKITRHRKEVFCIG